MSNDRHDIRSLAFTIGLVAFFVLIILLQLFPLTGAFFLMFWGSTLVINVVLPNLITVTFVIEVLMSRLPKYLLAIPALLYAIYFYFVFVDLQYIKKLEDNYISRNPSLIVKYNPEKHAIVSDADMVENYYIPVIYTKNHKASEGYFAYRFATGQLCYKNSYIGETLQITKKIYTDWCVLRTVEAPSHDILSFTETTNMHKGKYELRETVYSFFLNDEKIGEFTKASILALPFLPGIATGCKIDTNSQPYWECDFSLRKFRTTLRTSDRSIDRMIYGDWPVAQMLRIERLYSLNEFSNYDSTIAAFENHDK